MPGWVVPNYAEIRVDSRLRDLLVTVLFETEGSLGYSEWVRNGLLRDYAELREATDDPVLKRACEFRLFLLAKMANPSLEVPPVFQTWWELLGPEWHEADESSAL